MILPHVILLIETVSARRLTCLIVMTHCLAAIALANRQDIKPNPKAEQYVRAQLANDEPADLGKFAEVDRGLGPNFLYDLLTRWTKNQNLPRDGLMIWNAQFPAGVDLENADVPIDVEFKNCSFAGDIKLSQSHFRKSLRFVGSEFSGDLHLIDSQVDGYLRMPNLRFTNENGKADIRRLRVGWWLDMRESSFAGNVFFIGNEIGGNLDVMNTHFTNPTAEVSFDSNRVSGMASFKDSEFLYSASFAYAVFGQNLDMENVHFGNPYYPDSAKIVFNSMKVGRNALFHRTIFNGWVDFANADIGVHFEPTEAQFNAPYRETSFREMKTGVADFGQAKFATRYSLAGMEYKELKANDLRDFLKKADYSPDAYGNLEAYLRRQGMEGRADDIFVDQRWRERDGLSFPGKLANLFLFMLVRYGRWPWLAFVWSALFVSVGWVVFRRRRPEDMQPQKPEYKDRPYSAFLYSLDLFLPFVDLQADDAWEPSKEQLFARWYAPIHTLLGWILIPIGLAALSGLIK